MIRELSIANLGVIEHTRLTFSPGLTVLTGETGAGKTLITTALGQLLGARADAGLVRHGADEAVVDCAMTAPVDSLGQLEEIAATLEDDELLVTRTIGANTRSRAIVGSRSVAAATLADIVGHGVTLHGQHGQTRLTKPAEQRSLLDAAGAYTHLLDSQRDISQELRAARSAFAEFTAAQSTASAHLERLRQLVDDVESLAPTPNEDVELTDRIAMLANVDEVQRIARIAYAALAGDPDNDDVDVLQLLARTRKQLDTGNLPAQFAPWAERVTEIQELTSALAHDINTFADALDADPATLEALQQRKAAVTGLLRRWNLPLADLLAEYAEAEKHLAFSADPDTQRAALQQRVTDAEAAQERACAALHDARRKAAKALSKSVQTELRELGLPHASFEISVTRGGEPNQFGDDVVEFMFSANPGLPAQSLAAVGSGGELSRVMLALEVAAADARDRTFIFDEVDAGIGGKAALEVGRRLAQLAKQQQVIVVTHLPQVAAFADQHVVVEKVVQGKQTVTTTRTLSEAERAREIARMLAGVDESAAATAHADELLGIAEKVRRVAG